MSLYPFFPHWQAVRVQDRNGTLWSGDWASSFGWLRRSGHFARFPSRPADRRDHGPGAAAVSDLSCNLLDFQARVFAGLVVGWIHKPVALGVERSYGKRPHGRLDPAAVPDEPLADPTATMLTDALVELAIESRAARLEEAVRAAEAAARSCSHRTRSGAEISAPLFSCRSRDEDIRHAVRATDGDMTLTADVSASTGSDSLMRRNVASA